MLNELIPLLKKTRIVFMATLADKKQPHVRPIALAHEENGKLYFCTLTSTGFYQDLQANNCIEFTSITTPEMVTWCRVSGKLEQSHRQDIKEIILDNNKKGRRHFATSDGSDLVVYQLTDVSAAIMDFSGNPPRIIKETSKN